MKVSELFKDSFVLGTVLARVPSGDNELKELVSRYFEFQGLLRCFNRGEKEEISNKLWRAWIKEHGRITQPWLIKYTDDFYQFKTGTRYNYSTIWDAEKQIKNNNAINYYIKQIVLNKLVCRIPHTNHGNLVVYSLNSLLSAFFSDQCSDLVWEEVHLQKHS